MSTNVTPFRQGFSAIQEGNAYQPYNVDLWNKVSFDIQPTNNPHPDITATRHCEYWITTIDLMEYQDLSTLSSPDDTMLAEVYTDTVACIYKVDGKCKCMLTPERLHILQKAFDKTKCSGLHDHIKPPPISFASELVGLIHGYSHIATDSLTSLHQIKKQLSHPNLHRRHIQGDVLQTIAKAIRQTPSPIHFLLLQSK